MPQNSPPQTEQEYRGYPALNSTALSGFHEWKGNHILFPREPKSYWEHGHAFEFLCRDEAQGTDFFHEKYFECDVIGKMPDELVGWIEAEEDLKSKYVYNKDGITLNKQKKTLHAYLDACLANPGKVPMGINEMEMLRAMVANLMRMPYAGHAARDLLEMAEFEVPIVWERDGIPKKALLDVLIKPPRGTVIPIDLKSTANPQQFTQMMKRKYWIQQLHYSEGCREVLGASEDMIFFCGMKANPYLAWAAGVDDDYMRPAKIAYRELCEDYYKWWLDGRDAPGYLPLQMVKPYF